MLQANEVIKRLKQLLGYKNDLELANLLGIKPNTLSSWKVRETLRYDKIIEICKKHKIDLADIKPWHIYLLVVEGKGILCYRFKRYTVEGELLFISDNPAFDTFTVNPNDVREIFCIRGAFLPNIKNLTDY